MNAAAARTIARKQLEEARRARLTVKINSGETICDGEARAAGYKTAAAAVKALTK